MLPAVMLSYVEYYRPKFSILENVVGLISHKVEGADFGNHAGNSEIMWAMPKFIMRAYIALG